MSTVRMKEKRLFFIPPGGIFGQCVRSAFWRAAAPSRPLLRPVPSRFPPPAKPIRKGAVAKFFFAAALLLHPEHSISRPRLPVTAQIFILGHSKADRGIFPGLPVDNFLCSTTTKLFSQNNGFPACFFAASSTAS